MREGSHLQHGLPQVAAAIAVAGWGLAVSSLALLVAGRPPVDEGLWFYTVDATVAAVYGTVAALLISRRPTLVGWLISLMAVGCGLAAFSYAGVVYSTSRPQPVGVFEAIAPWQSITWIPGTLASFTVVPWLVRDGRLGLGARLAAALGAVVSVGFTGIRLTLVEGQSAGALQALSLTAVVIGLLAAAGVLHRRFLRPAPERVGLGWLALGTAAMALSFLPLALGDLVDVPLWFTPSIQLAVQAVFPAAVLVVVLRQRLWGLDLALSRSVLAGALTVVIVVVYVVVTALARRLLPGEDAAQAVAAVAVVVAVQPARLWLQRRVRALVYGPDADPAGAVRRLGRSLGGARTSGELLAGLVESVGTALRLESVVLVGEGLPLARWGSPTSRPLVVPLAHRGRAVGALEVTAPPGETLDARARRTLDELAVVVAAGAALATASQDLDAARERLTSARLAERRVIRRELHDGLGPSLAGIRLGLQGARNVLAHDPAAAGELLAALQEELDGRVDDVRALSHSLLPPVLEELGLGPALSELAARFAGNGLVVEVSCSDADGLSPELAAAAYGIITEAVTNVSRHSGASTAWVRVSVGATLEVRVDDDGSGVADGATPGVGTSSMRERAQEQGGTLSIGPRAPSGTTVHASLPLREDVPAGEPAFGAPWVVGEAR
ncbi:histidine kinase [Spongisporangium articulatum]|uniref:histidine kinase n=1 Tax=Spongisporangium articulatum TaxID=3362603 RepID=A0ABW8AJP7_9ACTN